MTERPLVVARMPRATTARRFTIGRAPLNLLRYANVWEDADVLCEALAPVARGGRLLSIASAGDNALALLTLDPAEVAAVDLSLPQLAALELRVIAFRRLDHEALLAFLGARPQADRGATYARLRRDLSSSAQEFWDLNPLAIDVGPMHAGKFERYFAAFRRFVLPLIHSRRIVADLLAAKDAARRLRFYQETWDTRRWRFVFRLFFGRAVMGVMGRDPAFFAHVEAAVGDRILNRSRHALTVLDPASNPFLTYILTGNWGDHALPRYLRAEHHETIRSRLDRVTWYHAAAQLVPGTFDGFNLSNIFEYMSAADHEDIYAALAAHARPAGRLVYWNLLAPRGIPARLSARIDSLDEHAAALHARDRAWFYGALHVDEVRAT